MPFQMRFRTLFTLLLSLIVPAGSASADMRFNFENCYNSVDQTAFEQAQSFRFTAHNHADMLYCASFPVWAAGVFALLEPKCRSPPDTSCPKKITL